MPAALTTLPDPPIPSIPPPKRSTRAGCAQLTSAGIPDYDHFELIQGN